MKLIRMDSEDALFYWIISIVIPPLFIINLIILLCQVIPEVIRDKQERKEMAEHNDFLIQSAIDDIKLFLITEDDKRVVDEKLNIIKQSYLGKDAEVITCFQSDLQNDNLIKKNVYDFIDFLIGLYDTVPQEVLNLLPNANELCTKEINDCIDILNNNL